MDKQNCDQTTENIQLITLILSENQSHKCTHLLKEKHIRGGMVIIGRGTVSSAVLNLLGVTSQKREIISFLVKAKKSREIMDYFDKSLQLSKPGHGIAYITPVTAAIGLPGENSNSEQMPAGTAQCMEGECMFKKLTVIVDRGMANDVMDIARKAGIRGGTILHGRGTGAEIATSLFGIEIEPEKELVIILTPNELVDKVVHALSTELKLEEPGKGILFVEPVLDTRGLLK